MFSKIFCFNLLHHSLKALNFSTANDKNNKGGNNNNNTTYQQPKNDFQNKNNQPYQIYTLYNHKIPLETSKITNTFGIKVIDLYTSFSLFYSQFKKTKTPLSIKALIISQISIYIYKHHLRGRFMLSKYYDKCYKIEQKIISSPIIKFFSKDSLQELLCDSLSLITFSKAINAYSPKNNLNKILLNGMLGSTLTYHLNKASKKHFNKKYNIEQFEIFPNHFNIIPNLLLSKCLIDLQSFLIKSSSSSLGKYSQNLINYLYLITTGKCTQFISLFTSSSLSLFSPEGILSYIAILSSQKSQRNKIIPMILLHYLNPYSMWIFIKTKNSLYKEELDKLYTKQNISNKIKIYLKYISLNSLSYLLKI